MQLPTENQIPFHQSASAPLSNASDCVKLSKEQQPDHLICRREIISCLRTVSLCSVSMEPTNRIDIRCLVIFWQKSSVAAKVSHQIKRPSIPLCFSVHSCTFSKVIFLFSIVSFSLPTALESFSSKRGVNDSSFDGMHMIYSTKIKITI